MATEIVIPPLGESVTEASIGQWLKKAGDLVQADEPIVSLETDKVAIEVPAPAAGVLTELLAEPGETVAVGAVVARMDAGAQPEGKAGSSAPSKDATTPAPAPSKAGAPAAEPGRSSMAAEPEFPAEPSLERGADGPAVRRLLEQYRLDPASIEPSGPDGRLTKGDVLSAIAEGRARLLEGKSATPDARAPQSAAEPERLEERVRMTRLRQTIARRLKEAQNSAAILTTFNDVDMSAVIDARSRYRDAFEKKHGVRLGFMSFFVYASCLALREVPAVNAAIEGDEIVYRRYMDIGVAVSGPGGLVVPILRNAERLSFAETELAIADFGRRARDGSLKLEELQGGTFTISNGGIFGSLMSTPILNPPQSGVLGMHRIEERPVVHKGAIVARPMMYLALSYDHRLVDGREAVTFLVRVKEALEDPTRLLVDL